MITGFNTDIEHDGVVYHVQTEDKGLDSPVILSLVYAGGTILASKRSPYQDLIAEGFSDEVLAERLKRQHRLICAAIHSGRIDDLKRMGARKKPPEARENIVESTVAAAPEELAAPPDAPKTDEAFEIEYWPMTQEWSPPPPAPAADEDVNEQEFELVEEAPGAEVEEDVAIEPVTESVLEDGLAINLLDEDEFYSGQKYTVRVLISNRSGGEEKPLAQASVSVKILGTTFRPLIYNLKTESDGVASVLTEIPQFTSGRAAVLVRVVAKDLAAELRRIIHPAK